MSDEATRKRRASDSSDSSSDFSPSDRWCRGLLVNRAALQERFLDCSICLQGFNMEDRKPKTLNCGHVICLLCLLHGRETLNHYQKRKISCPICRKENMLTKREIENLPNAYFVMQMMEFVKETSTEQENVCTKHWCQPRNIFCQTCQVPVCEDCTVFDHRENQNHVLVDVAQELEEQKIIFENIKVNCTNILDNMKTKSNLLENADKNLIEDETRLKNSICAQFTEYHRIMREREEELKKLLHETVSKERFKLKDRMRQRAKEIAQLQTCLEDFSASLQSNNIMKVVAAKKKLKSREATFLMYANEVEAGLLQSCDVCFEDQKLLDCIRKLGKVTRKLDPDLVHRT